jgi:hypothetical protein
MRGRLSADASTDRWSRHDWWGVVIDAPDPLALGRFYSELLGWEIDEETASDDGCALAPPEGVAYLSVQRATDYVRPVWPSEQGRQQMQMHLDFEVSDLEQAVAHAVEIGATEADFQPQDDVRVMLDPVGHPFCLYT